MIRFSPWLLLPLVLIGCAKPVADAGTKYASFRQANPRSILIVPVVNRTVEVTAADYFMSTIAKPVAERGYYVYPTYLVKRLMEDDGLGDADLVHQTDPKRLGGLFGSDAILYVTIDQWDAKYAVFSTSVEVSFRYVLKSAHTSETLWSTQEAHRYSSQDQGSGSGLGGLLVAAVSAGIAKAAPDFIPLAQKANANAVQTPHHGLPAGPHAADHNQDTADF